MKKLLILSVLAIAGLSACKKKETAVSSLYTYSTPTITISGNQYYSIPVGGTLPSVSASAYDSFYHESYPVLLDQSTLDNSTPGLYVITASARNKYGMSGSRSVYVAVTDISSSIDLSGKYKRTTNGVIVNVAKLATGLYVTDNVGGVNPIPENASLILPAYFVQVSDEEIIIPLQPSSQGELEFENPTLSTTPGVTFSYIIKEPKSVFAQSVRAFEKQ